MKYWSYITENIPHKKLPGSKYLDCPPDIIPQLDLAPFSTPDTILRNFYQVLSFHQTSLRSVCFA